MSETAIPLLQWEGCKVSIQKFVRTRCHHNWNAEVFIQMICSRTFPYRTCPAWQRTCQDESGQEKDVQPNDRIKLTEKKGGIFVELGVSEMASAKMASAIGVRIDDVGSILKFRIGFPFGENPACFCQSVWLPRSILNFRIGSVSSIGGLIAATLFADTVSDS